MIGIVIPTFNEKENIFKLSKKLLNLHKNSKIFIVDDTKRYNLKKEFRKKKILNIFIVLIKKEGDQQY